MNDKMRELAEAIQHLANRNALIDIQLDIWEAYQFRITENDIKEKVSKIIQKRDSTYSN